MKQIHALDWIKASGRFLRTISMSRLRKNLEREKGHCTWCNGELISNFRRWCSDDCRTNGYLRGGVWKGPVFKRDKGVCLICGKDTLEEQERFNKARRKAKTQGNYERATAITEMANKRGYDLRKVPYEIDHIIPVVEGGGLCGLDGLRTLCIPCHKTETKNLRSRRAKNRPDNQKALAFAEQRAT